MIFCLVLNPREGRQDEARAASLLSQLRGEINNIAYIGPETMERRLVERHLLEDITASLLYTVSNWDLNGNSLGGSVERFFDGRQLPSSGDS